MVTLKKNLLILASILALAVVIVGAAFGTQAAGALVLAVALIGGFLAFHAAMYRFARH